MKKFRIWWIQSKYRVVLALKLWAVWSNFYQKIERTFMCTYEDDPRMMFSNDGIDPIKSWKDYCSRNLLEHYGTDKWYMGFDVVSDPGRFLYRGKGDCDDYALLGYDYFGKHIKYKNVDYIFKGLFSIVWEDASGHAISIYGESNGEKKYLMISNDNIVELDNFVEYWNGKSRKVKWVGMFDVRPEELIYKSIEEV